MNNNLSYCGLVDSRITASDKDLPVNKIEIQIFIPEFSPIFQFELVQVNLCQKHLFLDQLTHNMTNDCSLIYQFSTWKQQAQNMRRTCCVHKLFWMSKQKQKTIFVHNMFSPCSEPVVFMYWTGKSMNNLLPYCGLVDVRINASDKNLPVARLGNWS